MIVCNNRIYNVVMKMIEEKKKKEVGLGCVPDTRKRMPEHVKKCAIVWMFFCLFPLCKTFSSFFISLI